MVGGVAMLAKEGIAVVGPVLLAWVEVLGGVLSGMGDQGVESGVEVLH